ncbi:MAG: twin-arginine translocase TatA/TatE family subunit [Peptococcaceae bacterium]|nr:twin-arginine translocase TatA/TatE family subunit [Peptococcaceae bacterium]
MGLSIGEIIVILLVAFLVLGPDKLPEVGRSLGKTVNSFKKALSDNDLNLKDEVESIKKEAGLSDISTKSKEKESQFKSELDDLKKDLMGASKSSEQKK